jgi:hypothetical protein
VYLAYTLFYRDVFRDVPSLKKKSPFVKGL